jgi:hypothetical protein
MSTIQDIFKCYCTNANSLPLILPSSQRLFPSPILYLQAFTSQSLPLLHYPFLLHYDPPLYLCKDCLICFISRLTTKFSNLYSHCFPVFNTVLWSIFRSHLCDFCSGFPFSRIFWLYCSYSKQLEAFPPSWFYWAVMWPIFNFFRVQTLELFRRFLRGPRIFFSIFDLLFITTNSCSILIYSFKLVLISSANVCCVIL